MFVVRRNLTASPEVFDIIKKNNLFTMKILFSLSVIITFVEKVNHCVTKQAQVKQETLNG